MFTAGIGENQIRVRQAVCDNLKFMGVEIDKDLNNVQSEEREISKPDSKVKVFIIPTDEEMMIAEETMAMI